MECRSNSITDGLPPVPLFPLPNVVLFPRAVLPLHIFEDRYKTMTADALDGNRLIAMALLRPGWEKNYYQRPPIEPVVCIGKILSAERLPDGKYNFLLQGESRARILREENSSPYRVARLELLPESSVMEIDLSNQRQRLVEMFCSEPLASIPAAMELKKLVASPMPTRDVADLIAFYLLSNIALKQSLLSEPDAARRVARVISTLDAALPVFEATSRGATPNADAN